MLWTHRASSKTPWIGSLAIGCARLAEITIFRAASSATFGCASRILRRAIGCAPHATVTITMLATAVPAANGDRALFAMVTVGHRGGNNSGPRNPDNAGSELSTQSYQ
jgi:hypothetical protein